MLAQTLVSIWRRASFRSRLLPRYSSVLTLVKSRMHLAKSHELHWLWNLLRSNAESRLSAYLFMKGSRRKVLRPLPLPP